MPRSSRGDGMKCGNWIVWHGCVGLVIVLCISVRLMRSWPRNGSRLSAWCRGRIWDLVQGGLGWFGGRLDEWARSDECFAACFYGINAERGSDLEIVCKYLCYVHWKVEINEWIRWVYLWSRLNHSKTDGYHMARSKIEVVAWSSITQDTHLQIERISSRLGGDDLLYAINTSKPILAVYSLRRTAKVGRAYTVELIYFFFHFWVYIFAHTDLCYYIIQWARR